MYTFNYYVSITNAPIDYFHRKSRSSDQNSRVQIWLCEELDANVANFNF